MFIFINVVTLYDFFTYLNIISRLWRKLININSIVQLNHAKELN